MNASVDRDSAIMAALQKEPLPTYLLARRFKTTSQKMRRNLIKMERAGLVERCPRWTFVNSITWQAVQRRCPECDGTGYMEHAGFAMDPCDHG